MISEQAATLTDACKMVTAARYYPQLMSIMGNSLRFLPAFVQMKRLLGEAYCGKLAGIGIYSPPPPKKEKNIGVYIQLKSRGQ